ncbi:hypothetical protein HHK36_023697 [Tetracentron sinense]|uniref:CTLH domain-containing protein n=1 Tax=Tetracentron sinense TaxID=13715 RepID=A0A835D5M1_TETSI|nr:hypothetical protein HHK36_023697 [Tetracentron sinense]
MAGTTSVDALNAINFENDWIIDSGCGHYLTGDDSKFSRFRDYNGNDVIIMADNSIHPVEKEGVVTIKGDGDDHITPNSMFQVSGMKKNLFAVANIVDSGHYVLFGPQDVNFLWNISDLKADIVHTDGATIGSVGSNTHVHIDAQKKSSLQMTPSAPMVPSSSSSSSIGKQCYRRSGVGCHELNGQQDSIEEVKSAPPLRKSMRQIILSAQYRDGNFVTSNRMFTREEWEKKLEDVVIRKEDMNELIMDFLVTEGYTHAAEKFEIESRTKHRMAVKKAIQDGNVEDAIERVNNLNPKILETNPELDFHLQQQRLIELIRNKKEDEALDFAKKVLAPKSEENIVRHDCNVSLLSGLDKKKCPFLEFDDVVYAIHSFLEALERTISLLAFEDASNCPVGELLHISHRLKTASEVNEAILTSQSHEKESKLSSFLKMLIWTQNQLDEKATYPHINDLSTATLEYPAI